MYPSHDVATQNLDLEFPKTIPSNANGTVMAQQFTLKFVYDSGTSYSFVYSFVDIPLYSYHRLWAYLGAC
jgi:hypothetical protein